MPSVRDLVLSRAKVPAKMHAMEVLLPTTPATPEGSVSPLNVGPDPIVAALGSRPPRPPKSSDSGTGSNHLPRRSEARRPRPGSEPAKHTVARSRAGQSAAGTADEGDVVGQPINRARSSSAPRQMRDAAPPVEHKGVGKVPPYLRRRRVELAEQKRLAARTPSPQPPPGFRKVDEPERQGSLAVLNQRKVEAEKAHRNLPFKIETAGQKQREKELVNRIAHIEKLLGMFEKPVVFVPFDAEPISVSTPPLETDSLDEISRSVAGRQSEGGQCCPSGVAMREALQCPSSRDVPSGGGGSDRGSRAHAPSSARRRRVLGGGGLPWEQEFIEASAPVKPLKTSVQVVAPPGGKSNLQFF
uniref:Enkurin domain-containing protein n=1 Tax=Noctiluca scintillans TaxID=2966 RepID=A0A7S1FJW5_NOCSC|mmetsp:Transcript_7449/g.20424  ORF Transcript_7449/g.20424 Transcript_7449/m.20424 type:complete len:357 (+) Transcript_7449:103-1173(+)|eukprot:CAMPEP_0194547230 /NCGR_PEP_ID=MMETSP0253-20130528/91836_1 /TAXON_ID=2966 /ORGANISM="Noctiluca scintillans" /LENGTH=356 /DNA_ID=CAMNT_0039394415 /DNA_START=99 /DNA_END=1169 /DNA_ORIENTATION=-